MIVMFYVVRRAVCIVCMQVRKVLLPIAERNAKLRKDAGAASAGAGAGSGDVLDSIHDMREYDVPYYVRVSIDAGVRVGCWYSVHIAADNAKLTRLESMVEKVGPCT